MNFKDETNVIKTVKHDKYDIHILKDANGVYGYIVKKNPHGTVAYESNFNNEQSALNAAKLAIKSRGNMYDSACNYIDSVVGNIARKIEDEFNEKDHPRDKGGKFTSKGGEGKGGAEENSNVKSVKHGKYNIKVHKHGDDKYSYYSYENDKDGSITYASGNASSEEEALKKAKNKLDEHDKRYGTIPETETEKAAKEELASTKSDEETLEGLDDYGQNLLDYCTDIDTANDALRALNWDTSDYEDLEQARTALKEAISQNPKAAKELWESTTNKEEIEEVRAGRETDEIVEEFKGSGIDMYAALADLGIDVQRTPEAYHEDVFKEKLFNSPKFRQKAKEYIKQYRGTEDEEEWFK